MEDALIYRNGGNATLLEMLPSGAGRVLDCGCGPGDNAAILSAAGWRVTAITIDPAEQEAARPFCELVVIADLERGLPAEVGDRFDVLLMSHVLEHLARPEAILRDARLRLKPDGMLAVALPNILHYRQRFKFLKGDFTYTDIGILDRTHLRFYTVTTGRQLLETAGFDILDARADGALPWRGLRGIVSAGVRRRLDEVAVRRWPNLFARQSLFTARVSREPRSDSPQD